MEPFIELGYQLRLGSVNYFNVRIRDGKSNLDLNNQLLKIYPDKYRGDSFEILKLVYKEFKVLRRDLIGRDFHYYINLIPENLTYYELYKYSATKMKSGDIYVIKPLYPLFKDNFEESLNYSKELISDFSSKLHHLRSMYDVGFSCDGKVIEIRILPK